MLRRLLQLFIGLTLYGVSTAMFVRADLGADPWNVFHLGVANLLSMNIGVVIIAVVCWYCWRGYRCASVQGLAR